MSLSQRLALFDTPAKAQQLTGILRGIEKESLRITPDGTLADTPHPQALGSALTHPQITTDYSEALLEFITQPHCSIDALLGQLDDIHRYTYQNINDESLWVSSMPCMLGEDADIPIARYGKSNSGQMKSIYRLGLGHRYGRVMQTIAGVHYNFSLPDSVWQALHQQEQSELSLQDFKTQRYFDLIRNFRRYFWLLLYLFGSAPAVCRSFVRNREHQLLPFNNDEHSLHTPYATSLRMGNLGYQSTAQEQLIVCYNKLDNYINTLCGAITQPHADYNDIGLNDESGERQQLNTSLLQIENEFYSTIRPKRTAKAGETALGALHDRGVEYIEVRCVDLNPYEPLGINTEQIRVMDAFLLYCLLEDSPESDLDECQQIAENQKRMVYQGRDPELMLLDKNGERNMREWGRELLDGISNTAKVLDKAYADEQDDALFSQSLKQQYQKLDDAELTPSARILRDMREQDISFFRLSMNLAEQHQTHFNHAKLDDESLQLYRNSVEESHHQQLEIEAADTLSLEEYLQNYYAQYRCGQSTAP